MINYHKFFSLGLGLLFLVVLGSLSYPTPVFRFLLPAYVFIAYITFIYSRWYLKQKEKYNFWIALKPILLQTAGFLIFLVLPSGFYRGMFFLFSVFFITVFQIFLAEHSENILFNEIFVIAFGFCLSLTGIAWYFPGLFYILSGIFFLSILLTTRCFFEFLPIEKNQKWLNSLIISFLSTQIFWVQGFLPFHFTALSILVFLCYMLLSVFSYYYFHNSLNFKKVKFFLILTGVSVFLVFATTQWRVIDI